MESTGTEEQQPEAPQDAEASSEISSIPDSVLADAWVAATFYRETNYGGRSPYDVMVPSGNRGTATHWSKFPVRSVRLKKGCTLYLYVGESGSRYLSPPLTTDYGEQFPSLSNIYNLESFDISSYAVECDNSNPHKGTVYSDDRGSLQATYLRFWSWTSQIPKFWFKALQEGTPRALTINPQVLGYVSSAAVSNALPLIPSYGLREPKYGQDQALALIRATAVTQAFVNFGIRLTTGPIPECPFPNTCYHQTGICSDVAAGGVDIGTSGNGVNLQWCQDNGGRSYCTTNRQCISLVQPG